MGLWEAHDAGRASTQEPANARQGDPRTRPNARQAGEAGEDADTADQDQRQERADGRLQDPGQGLGPHEALYRKVLFNAQPTTKDLITAPGTTSNSYIHMGNSWESSLW